MTFQSGLCVEQCWARQSMDVFTNHRVVTGELNGKRRQHFDSADVSQSNLQQNTWEVMWPPSSKRHCNGLNSLQPSASAFGIEVNERAAEVHEVEKMVVDECNTVVLEQPQKKASSVCQRCLAGEPGHIKHIVSMR